MVCTPQHKDGFRFLHILHTGILGDLHESRIEMPGSSIETIAYICIRADQMVCRDLIHPPPECVALSACALQMRGVIGLVTPGCLSLS